MTLQQLFISLESALNDDGEKRCVVFERSEKLLLVNEIIEFIVQLPGFKERLLEQDVKVRFHNKWYHYDLSPEANQLLQIGSAEFVTAELVGSLMGGKGGFGASLRAAGHKSQGSKQSVDFGLCRDLQGRRLRNVNNEIRLSEWRKAAAENNQQAAGASSSSSNQIDESKRQAFQKRSGWYLDVPNWATVPQENTKKRHRGKYKTELCKDWLESQDDAKKKNNKATDINSGCPRGEFCPFAHGKWQLREEEGNDQIGNDDDGSNIRKKSKVGNLSALEEEEERIIKKSKEFAKVVEEQESRMASSVSEGLRKHHGPEKSGSTRGLEHSAEQEEDEEAPFFALSQIGLHPLQGEAGLGISGEIEGRSSFCTVAALDHSFIVLSKAKNVDDDGNDDQHFERFRYFEAQVLSPGSFQVGFAKVGFQPEEDQGLGVGDVPGSVSFDPLRRKIFVHGSIELDSDSANPSSSTSSAPLIMNVDEDLIGCVFDVVESVVWFTLNGILVGESINPVETPHTSIAEGNGDGIASSLQPNEWFPAISLNHGVAVRINIGNDQRQRPFRFRDASLSVGSLAHSSSSSSSSSSSKNSRTTPTIATTSTTTASASAEVDLTKYKTVSALCQVGLETLKVELEKRGLKQGGTLEQRASRLFSVRNLQPAQYPKSILAENKKNKEGER